MTEGSEPPPFTTVRAVDLSDFATDAAKDAYFARGRLTGHTYWSRSWTLPFGQDAGFPGRFAYKVLDIDDWTGSDTDEEADSGDADIAADEENELLEVVLRQRIRFQLKAIVGREAGRIKDFRIQRIPANGEAKDLLRLKADEAMVLADFFKTLRHLSVEGEEGQRIDDAAFQAFLADPQGMRAAYEREPTKFTNLITEDVTANDVIALANRRQQVEDMRRLMNDPEYFEERRAELGTRGPEGVWQAFLEANPWILGIGLSGQLLTSWNADKLEQVVSGFSITGRGKRVDALLRTAGSINSMVFAEIKHHETPLLDAQYRPDCWPPSRELAGGVTQVHQTVYRARAEIGERIMGTDKDGYEENTPTFLIRPRSFLIIGHLDQLQRDGGVHLPKLQSFELFRRHLQDPEVLTFDELLARAEWTLQEAKRLAEEQQDADEW